MPADEAPDDPNVRQMLSAAAKPGGSALAGRHPPRRRPAHRAGQPDRRRHRGAERPGRSRLRLQRRRSSCGRASATSARSPTSWSQFTQSQTARLDQITGNVADHVRTGGRRVATTSGPSWPGSTPPPATASSQDVMNNAQATSADLQQSAADLRDLMAAARANEASLVRVLVAADSLLSRDPVGPGHPGHAGRGLDALQRDHEHRDGAPTACSPTSRPIRASTSGSRCSRMNRAATRTGSQRGRHRVPARPGPGGAFPPDPGLATTTGASPRATSRSEESPAEAALPRNRRGDRPRGAAAARADPDHRLALPVPRARTSTSTATSSSSRARPARPCPRRTRASPPASGYRSRRRWRS